jgi:hypothetical protein
MLLVSIRHQVERGLVSLATLAGSGGRALRHDEYQQLLKKTRKKAQKAWKETIVDRLSLKAFREWSRSVECLRLLANSYKHNPLASPDRVLLAHLGLDTSPPYAPLAESETLRKGLARYLQLQADADYCDIADEFLARAGRFLAEVEAKARADGILSRLKVGTVSFKPDEMLH